MSLRARIFLMFALVVGTSFVALVWWIRDDLRPRYLESLEEPLVDTAQLLAELLAEDVRDADGRDALRAVFARAYARRFRARIYDLERDRIDLRVYVTDAQGIVVFDSDQGRDEGRDYSRWNDIARTLRGEYGARSTRDDSLDPVHSVVYVAAPIVVGGETVGVLSVGKPKRNVDQFVRAAQAKVLTAGLVAMLAALALGLVLTVWLTRPLERLRAYARDVTAGHRATLPPLGAGEIAQTGQVIENMRTALEGKRYIEGYVQTLTHELKSPLAAIRGAAELLQENPPQPDRTRFLGNIRDEVQRMQNLVERLLAQAKLEQRRALEQAEMIELGPLVEELLDSLQPLVLGKAMRIESALEAGGRIRGERFLLRQAILNLLQNALDFAPDGSALEVQLNRRGAELVLQLRDQGPGIPAYAQASIFDRFYSLPRPDGRKSTGLGLSFVREVATLHGGSIEVGNHPAGGAQAVLRLPAA